MTGSQALDRVAGPSRWEKTAEPPDLEPTDIDEPDPIDLGWTDSPDWPEPDYPDPSWPGWGRGLRPAPPYLSDLAVSDWDKERHPDKPANPWHAFPAGRDPQPSPERDKSADWEAGQ